MKKPFFLFFFFAGLLSFGQTWQKNVTITREKPVSLGKDSFFLVTKTRVTDLVSGKFTEVSEGVVYADTSQVNSYIFDLEKKRLSLLEKISGMKVEAEVLQSMIRQATESKNKQPATPNEKEKKPPPKKVKSKKGGG